MKSAAGRTFSEIDMCSCAGMVRTLRGYGVVSELRQDGEDPQRCAGAAFDLHRNGKDRRSCRRQASETGNVLEDRHVGFAEDPVGNEVARLAIVDTWRVDAHGVDFTFFNEKLRRISRKAG